MRAAKADANQKEIVAALRAAGCSVESLHRVGGGVPDLLVGRQGRNYLIEVKPEKRKRNDQPEQQLWRDNWRGHWLIVRSVEDVWLWLNSKESTE